MNLDQYPRAKQFFIKHPEMSIDDALSWTEKQLENTSQHVDKKRGKGAEFTSFPPTKLNNEYGGS